MDSRSQGTGGRLCLTLQRAVGKEALNLRKGAVCPRVAMCADLQRRQIDECVPRALVNIHWEDADGNNEWLPRIHI
jgi:hypothetical protein